RMPSGLRASHYLALAPCMPRALLPGDAFAGRQPKGLQIDSAGLSGPQPSPSASRPGTGGAVGTAGVSSILLTVSMSAIPLVEVSSAIPLGGFEAKSKFRSYSVGLVPMPCRMTFITALSVTLRIDSIILLRV